MAAFPGESQFLSGTRRVSRTMAKAGSDIAILLLLASVISLSTGTGRYLHIINQRKVKAAGVDRQIEESPLLDLLFGESVESEVEARFDVGGKNDNQHLYPVCTPDLEGKVKDHFESKQAIYQFQYQYQYQ